MWVGFDMRWVSSTLAVFHITFHISNSPLHFTFHIPHYISQVLWRLLSLVPLSRLGLLSRARTHQEIISLCSDYSIVENEFFFDRHPRSFNTILNFYRTGKLHLADEMCVLAFGEDLHYWGLSTDHLDACCYDKFIGKRELVIEQMEGNSRKVKKEEEDDFGDGKFAKYQKMIWDLMEKSETSTAAQVGYYCFLFCQRPHFKYPGGLSDFNVFCCCLYCWNGDQHNATVEVNRRAGKPGGKPKTSHDRNSLHSLVHPRVFPEVCQRNN